MSTTPIRPTTLVGIRRLAKAIKSEQGLLHSRALNVAAQIAGHQNYAHAITMLDASPTAPPTTRSFQAFVTIYWKDREAGAKGRETLEVPLSIPLDQLLKPSQIRNARYLAGMRFEAADHLIQHEYRARSRSEARREACRAHRTLTFMDVTGLRPTRSHSRPYPDGDYQKAVPGHDHGTTWYDPAAKAYVVADEPCRGAVDHKTAEREAWSKLYAFAIAKPAWAGMYNPDGRSELYLIADTKKGYSLEPMIAALNRAPVPMVEVNWIGESDPSPRGFVSPAAEAKAQISREAPKPVRGQPVPRNSVGYVRTFIGPQTRPSGAMPIDAHFQVGELLKAVLVDVQSRAGVYKRVDRMRSELDEWAMREPATQGMSNPEFNAIYYGEFDSEGVQDRTSPGSMAHVASLTRAKQILTVHYPDSAPLRAMLKTADAAIKSLET